MSTLLKLSKNCTGRNTSKLILQGHHHPDTKTRQRYHKKRKLETNITNDYWWKIINKMLANSIQQHIKSIIPRNLLRFIPECKDSSIYANQPMGYTILANYRIKIMFISIDAGKAFGKIQHSLMIKTTTKKKLSRKWAWREPTSA